MDRHAADFGTNYTPEECVFTTGGKLALFNAIQVLVDHGDEVILPVPYWVSFKDIIQYAGGVVVPVVSKEEENFRITAQMIEAAITPKTKAIILNTPSNPSGAVVSAADLEAIVRLAHARGIFVREVILLAIASAVTRKPWFSSVCKNTGTPPAYCTMSLNETQ